MSVPDKECTLRYTISMPFGSEIANNFTFGLEVSTERAV
jgi:hypothetical protein